MRPDKDARVVTDCGNDCRCEVDGLVDGPAIVLAASSLATQSDDTVVVGCDDGFKQVTQFVLGDARVISCNADT